MARKWHLSGTETQNFYFANTFWSIAYGYLKERQKKKKETETQAQKRQTDRDENIQA